MTGEDPPLAAVAVDPLIAAEHPGLRVWSTRAACRPRRTPPELRERLALLADRFRGAEAVVLRARPVPSAYRVLFRHLGIDPDVRRTPLEQLAVERLLTGGFAARGLPDDALALATLETGVPVWALDAARLEGAIVLRPDESGRLVLADAAGVIAALFDPPGAAHAPARDTRSVVLLAVQAPGVDDLFVEEALWVAAAAL